nr:histone H2A-Bbd type 2/3 [Oryctolagus cuniculus]XP_051691987.1 LOW QUALITY PROTEIN: histone H2A-Bbd type 2/3-like [Oryctolagus cuniculus]
MPRGDSRRGSSMPRGDSRRGSSMPSGDSHQGSSMPSDDSRPGSSMPSSDSHPGSSMPRGDSRRGSSMPSDDSRPGSSMPSSDSRRGSSHRRRRARSRTARAQLTFSVSQVERRLRQGHYAQRLSSSASVFLAATIEFLTAKVLELAGNEAHNIGSRRITPHLVDMAVHNHGLLSGFFGTATISQVAPGRGPE